MFAILFYFAEFHILLSRSYSEKVISKFISKWKLQDFDTSNSHQSIILHMLWRLSRTQHWPQSGESKVFRELSLQLISRIGFWNKML